MGELEQRILEMAKHAKALPPLARWPAWSTGETLMVALVLNDTDMLEEMGYTMVEAFDRVDLSAAELRGIERKLRS